jgi:cation diffusion facilitator CzcD-associated flavoprotein CzcO
MSASSSHSPHDSSSTFPERLDVLVIGAGVAGLCALQGLRQLGLTVRAYESASDVGGVWYWNRYPGARFDSESYTYCYSFSQELLDEWDWQERFASQREILGYLNHVADRFDLRRDICFDTRVVAARYDARDNSWLIETDRGHRVRARYLVTAVGGLSAPQLPAIEGIENFAGKIYHTARWPHQGVDLSGKRVGVVGTGATGVQVIQTIAPEVAQLTVFQRTANYCVPQRNAPLTDAERREIKRSYPAIFARCRESYGGFIHTFDSRSGLDVSREEREAKFEALWSQPGFAFWFGNFKDLMTDETVNAWASEFVKRKIRERVRDPATAAKLMPQHPFGTKRVPLENGYYDVYNEAHVELVDLRESPMQRITQSGIRTTRGEHCVDVIVFATGFDAVTGALNRIDIRGLGGQSLRDKWQAGPKTYLGLQVEGFPNLFTIAGPHNAASLCNAVRCTEQNVEWIAQCIGYMREKGFTRIAPTAAAEVAWTRHVREVAEATLLRAMTDSWFFGANTPGKARSIAIYAGGAAAYRMRCEEVARQNYEGFELRGLASPADPA